MGGISRSRGIGYERELVNFLKEGGLHAQRVPLSGATEYAKGDIEVTPGYDPDANPLTGECKRKRSLPDWLTKALGANDFAAFREDRGETLIVIRASLFRDLLQ